MPMDRKRYPENWEKNIYDAITGLKFKGIKDNKILHICFDSVMCIYREGITEEL